jgi:hypothetical protein
MSIATILRAASVPPPVAVGLHAVLVAAGLFIVLLLRDRPGLSFAVTVVLLAVGTPVVNIGSPAILIAALAPLAWPWPGPAALTGSVVAAPPALPLTTATSGPDPLPSGPDTTQPREAR